MSKLAVATLEAEWADWRQRLRPAGIGVNVYEQATRFSRLRAGIQIGCNAMKL